MGTTDWKEDNRGEVERLEEEIAYRLGQIAKKQAYLDFLKANPLFQEFLKLKSEAN